MDIHIPPAALEAGARAICETENGPCDVTPGECGCTYWTAHARAAIEAALSAWPGIKLENLCSWVMDGPDLPYVEETASIIFPLTETSTKENDNG